MIHSYLKKKSASARGTPQKNSAKFGFAIHPQGIRQFYDNCKIAKCQMELFRFATDDQACQQEREKKSEICLCALPRLAKPGEHVSWGLGSAVRPPNFLAF